MTGPRRVARKRVADAPEVLVALDANASTPLHRQVYDGLRDAILAGRLAAGERLPSTRVLADDLGVARNTVTLAFEQLRAEGYLVGHRGGGTRVRDAAPEVLLEVPRRPARVREPARVPARPATAGRLAPVALPARGAALVAAGREHVESREPRAFQLGTPAIDIFPASLWMRLTTRRWKRGVAHLGEGDVAGDPELRAAITAHVGNARGVRCTPEQVFVVNGAQQALDFVSRILLDAGDEVWMEDPGYMHARIAVRDAGARLVPVPVDDQGLDVAAGERLAPQARLACVTPSHQFPLGVVMSAPRRLALLAWARRANAWILEDDYDSEFRYSGRPLPCLQGLDVERSARDVDPRVLYVGTFSKTLAPGFRLAYLIVPESLVDTFRSARRALDRYAPTLEQGVLTDFIAEGHYARHVRRARALYAERQRVMLDAVDSLLAGELTVAPDAAGLHLVAWLREGVDDQSVVQAALREGVATSALSRYRMHEAQGARGALVLNYAGFDDRAITAGVHGLRRAFAALSRVH
ncbi:MAG: PLP-dependent aminotransferase family protein [Gemmatimonadaceae bacterium]|nr:PLP-dependent aminotransferase family protein [Gemmatimonadaceae bacterium]